MNTNELDLFEASLFVHIKPTKLCSIAKQPNLTLDLNNFDAKVKSKKCNGVPNRV
jgi:hypothetical protein